MRSMAVALHESHLGCRAPSDRVSFRHMPECKSPSAGRRGCCAPSGTILSARSTANNLGCESLATLCAPAGMACACAWRRCPPNRAGTRVGTAARLRDQHGRNTRAFAVRRNDCAQAELPRDQCPVPQVFAAAPKQVECDDPGLPVSEQQVSELRFAVAV